MDPDVALADLRHMMYTLSRQIQTGDISVDLAEAIFDQFENLDVWLTAKGYLPKQWQRAALSAEVVEEMNTMERERNP